MWVGCCVAVELSFHGLIVTFLFNCAENKERFSNVVLTALNDYLQYTREPVVYTVNTVMQ